MSKVGKESKEVTVSCFINHGSGDKIPSLNDNENDEEIAVGTVSILYEIVGISEVRFTLKNPNQYIGQRKNIIQFFCHLLIIFNPINASSNHSLLWKVES